MQRCNHPECQHHRGRGGWQACNYGNLEIRRELCRANHLYNQLNYSLDIITNLKKRIKILEIEKTSMATAKVIDVAVVTGVQMTDITNRDEHIDKMQQDLLASFSEADRQITHEAARRRKSNKDAYDEAYTALEKHRVVRRDVDQYAEAAE